MCACACVVFLCACIYIYICRWYGTTLSSMVTKRCCWSCTMLPTRNRPSHRKSSTTRTGPSSLHPSPQVHRSQNLLYGPKMVEMSTSFKPCEINLFDCLVFLRAVDVYAPTTGYETDHLLAKKPPTRPQLSRNYQTPECNLTERVKVKITVNFAVCECPRPLHTANFTVKLAMTHTSGAALGSEMPIYSSSPSRK